MVLARTETTTTIPRPWDGCLAASESIHPSQRDMMSLTKEQLLTNTKSGKMGLVIEASRYSLSVGRQSVELLAEYSNSARFFSTVEYPVVLALLFFGVECWVRRRGRMIPYSK
jgi:hypothetical protein